MYPVHFRSSTLKSLTSPYLNQVHGETGLVYVLLLRCVFLHLSRCARRYLKVAKDIRQSKTWSYEEHIRVLFLSRNIIQVNTLQKEVFIHKTTYIVMIVFIVLSHMFRFDESSLLLHCSDLLNLMKKTKFISMEQNKKKGKGPIKAFSQPCTTGPDKAHVDATKTNPIMEPMILGEVPLTGVDATCSRPLGNAGVDQHTRTPQLTLTPTDVLPRINLITIYSYDKGPQTEESAILTAGGLCNLFLSS